VDAILVGVNTVIEDDPLLTVRGVPSRPGRPIKVIVDSRLRTPLQARCLSSTSPAPTPIAATTRPSARRAALERRGAELLVLRPQHGRVPLRELCRVLARRGIQSVLIEGGAEVLASAFADRLVDRVVWFIAPLLIGGRGAPSALGGQGIGRLRNAVRLTDVEMTRVGPDFCVEARVLYSRGREQGAGGRGSSRAPRPAPLAPSQ
jgi:diaminohydroxyphosphoribosylaminopyrimidine deaminase/5-amino-6-(5-phosphoribosylamino)uracil reductase